MESYFFCRLTTMKCLTLFSHINMKGCLYTNTASQGTERWWTHMKFYLFFIFNSGNSFFTRFLLFSSALSCNSIVFSTTLLLFFRATHILHRHLLFSTHCHLSLSLSFILTCMHTHTKIFLSTFCYFFFVYIFIL